MISINFSVFFHLIIIFSIGLFLQNFLNLLYDQLMLFKEKKSFFFNQYNDEKESINQKITNISQSIKEVDSQIKKELDLFHKIHDNQLSSNENILSKKKSYTTLEEHEKNEIYNQCQEALKSFIK